MKTLTTYAKYFTLISKIAFLFFFLMGNIAEATTKTAKFYSQLGINKVFTYTFEGSSDMVASATTPEQIFFSKARDNSIIDTSFSSSNGQKWSVFNNWINTTVSGDTGYSFAGFTCSHICPQMQLPLHFTFDNTTLEPTQMRSTDNQLIFKIRQYPEIGVSFQLGKNYKGNVEWLENQSGQGEFLLTTLQIHFGDSADVSFQLRAKLHLLTLPTSDKNIPMMNLTLGKIRLQKWEVKNQGPARVSYIVQDLGSVNVKLSTPRISLMQQQRQCTLNSSQKNRVVDLTKVKKRELDTQDEMEGGYFKLRVNCQDTKYNKFDGKWLFPLVKLTFTGENETNNNGTNDLLRTVTGDGQAEGVSLKIKRENGTDTVKYGAASAQMGNAGQFELKNQPTSADGGQSADETFKVYYVKDTTRGTLTEGKVNAAATFTMSYQ
ncbi:TPA: fimbrial protein [Haemophilus influenzae]|uniref:P pilus assembly protein, pilin FimA n=3 Tax=Haemophilus influenzae TaxID=727 RepID=A0A0D0ICW5_HAEIF|nr:fimbrial protein [Haemophilus influenzae]KIP36584.1 fimbrial protein [Haemophilus influenzae]KIP48425.1 fimbrial protein [Haemophilus influenzae]KIS35725.1 P pilus assembly protein, pilin FimA [Haemophilus influenzae]PRL67248.1 Neisseria PilC protein [Haemophilus influenzae]